MPPTVGSGTSTKSSHLSQTAQSSIRRFGRIQKAASPPVLGKSLDSSVQSPNVVDTVENTLLRQSPAKRKREDLETAHAHPPDRAQHAHKKVKTATDHASHHSISGLTPRKTFSNPQNLPTPDTTPTKPLSPRTPQVTPTNGQQRLDDLKSLVANAQKPQRTTDTSTLPDSPCNRISSALQSRSNSLYDRLRTKAIERASAPAPPSAEAIARRNALQRLPDVVRVLAMPPARKTQARSSYSLNALVERVQQSARSPLGAKEIEGCLSLLREKEQELGAKGFVKFVEAGTMRAVTVDRRVRPLELERRIARMLEGAV